LLSGRSVQDAVFSPDGKRIATGHFDGTAQIWDARTGRRLTPPLKHRQAIHAVRFSPDGTILATTSLDSTARLWDSKTGEPMATFRNAPGWLEALDFSPDGRRIAAGNTGAQIWEVPRESRRTADLLKLAQILACQRVDREVGVVAVEKEEQKAIWRDLRRRYPQDFFTPPKSALRLAKRQAAAYLEGGQWARAVLCFSRALEIEPGDWRSWAERGQAYARGNQNKRAIADFDRAIALKKEEPSLYVRRARIYRQMGQAANAIADCTTALSINAEYAGALSLRAHLYAHARRWEEAAADYARAIQLGSGPEDWRGHAQALLAKGDIAAYRALCTDAVRRVDASAPPEEANKAAWTCALSAEAIPVLPEALRLAERAVAARPSFTSYLTTLGALLYRDGKYEAAVSRLTESESFKSGPENWLFLAMAHQRLGNAEEARRWLQRATDWLDGEDKKNQDSGALLELELFRAEAERLLETP
jgi:tetratricopeptide (TPR) repeat protein